MSTSHADRTRAEFTQQAASMERSATFRERGLLARLAAAGAPATDGALLDVGCGPGLVLEALAGRHPRAVGIDLTPEMARRAAERCAGAGLAHVETRVGCAYELPFGAGEFTCVVSRLVLHHLESPGDAIREMARVLAPGGRLLIADIVGAPNPVDAALHDALEQLRDPSHVRLLPGDEWDALLADADLVLTADEVWNQERGFAEWAAVVDDSSRTAPIETVMTALAGAGRDAGIGLRVVDGSPVFVHHWRLVAATGSTA